MGGGCRLFHNRETIYAGGKCENNCFSHYGGCNASDDIAEKQQETCEFKPPSNEIMLMSISEINKQISELTNRGKSVFLYVPDLFSDLYAKRIFKRLPNRNGNTYIATNASVNSLRNVDFAEIKARGIFEIWIGIESASKEIRDKYNKPEFENEEVIRITQKARDYHINICWYLVDGDEDSEKSKLETYELIKQGNPFRINIEQLQ